jgi:hypothetical protein
MLANTPSFCEGAYQIDIVNREPSHIKKYMAASLDGCGTRHTAFSFNLQDASEKQ